MKIVSFSLFGNKPRYTVNALVNADLCSKFYPNWECVIYYDNSVPQKIINLLKEKQNVSLIKETGAGHSRRIWRFYAYDNCEIFISRDIDSHINEREVSATQEWIKSDKYLHIMRDHDGHKNKMQAGMFGIKKSSKLNSLRDVSKKFISKSENHLSMDEKLLTNEIYDIFKQDMIVHDDRNFHNDKTNDWMVPILYNDKYGQFVGRQQYPPSANQNLFKKYQTLTQNKTFI